jgi:hypothetical protein
MAGDYGIFRRLKIAQLRCCTLRDRIGFAFLRRVKGAADIGAHFGEGA